MVKFSAIVFSIFVFATQSFATEDCLTDDRTCGGETSSSVKRCLSDGNACSCSRAGDLNGDYWSTAQDKATCEKTGDINLRCIWIAPVTSDLCKIAESFNRGGFNPPPCGANCEIVTYTTTKAASDCCTHSITKKCEPK